MIDARFFDPANQTEATVTAGFGAIFSDVDLANVTALKYYDAEDNLVYAQSVSAVSGAAENVQGSLSFAGLKFAEACITRVRLVSGTTALEAGVLDDPTADDKVDLVVIDDLIYGEPQATGIAPQPSGRIYLPVIAGPTATR